MFQLYDYHRLWDPVRPDIWITKDTSTPCNQIPQKYSNYTKVLILVLSQSANSDRRKLVRGTWASEASLSTQRSSAVCYKVLFVLGRSTNHLAFHPEQKQHEYDVIQADVTETYRNLTLKSQMGIDFAVNQCSNFDFVMKTDDDMYLNMDLISKFVLDIKRKQKPVFAGKCFFGNGPHRNKGSKWYIDKAQYPDKLYPPFCVGALYMMTMDIAIKLRG